MRYLFLHDSCNFIAKKILEKVILTIVPSIGISIVQPLRLFKFHCAKSTLICRKSSVLVLFVRLECDFLRLTYWNALDSASRLRKNDIENGSKFRKNSRQKLVKQSCELPAETTPASPAARKSLLDINIIINQIKSLRYQASRQPRRECNTIDILLHSFSFVVCY